LTFDCSFIDFLSCLENLFALRHISELQNLIEKAFTHTHTHYMSWASYYNYYVCRNVFAYLILVYWLYVCVILTCYLADFSELDTCVCRSTCEGTNLVVFLSLFSKLFPFSFSFSFLTIYLAFRTVFGFWFLVFFLKKKSVLPFVLLWQKWGVFFFYLAWDCIFNWSSDFCSRMAKGGVC
jgi:hypothetical protein